MEAPPADSPYRAEWDLLHALREAPELVARVTSARDDELALQVQLRREFPDSLVRAAFTLAECRRRAARKFSRAEVMWFDRQGLEQSTAEAVARHKAQRFSGDITDLCCGIGGDTLALAERGNVVAVDLNPCACLRTLWNAQVYSVAQQVATATGDATDFATRDGLLHIDPDRRRQGAGRVLRLEGYVPGLETLSRLMRDYRGGAIKVGPASNFGGKFPDCEIELVSLDGECREATVWFGDLRRNEPWRATVLPAGATLAGHPLDFVSDLAPPGSFIYDPDPAVVRAGLVDAAASQLDLKRLDAAEEYLTGDALVVSPFVTGFELLADLSNNTTEIRRYFREAGAAQVEIKCRHLRIDADTIRRRLVLRGDRALVLIFARVAGKARALVCRRLSPATPRQPAGSAVQ